MYKIPKVKTKITGRGNNVKTNINNILSISYNLGTNPEYIIKYIGIELGAISKLNGHYGLINGAHDTEDIVEILDKFIKLFVLCPHCKLLKLKIDPFSEKKVFNIKCISCDYKNTIGINKHKLVKFMFKYEKQQKQDKNESEWVIEDEED